MENKLQNENSLYLKQHKDNPVHWYPYGSEAINLAKEQNKPIFLSIGYSSCHWCHVMAEESFQDQETANFLNENFINIKVDKEEFPDLDSYYQQACQAFSNSGGWPLSAFLLNDLRPFYVGTYFPKNPVGQNQGNSFMQVLQELKTAFESNKKLIEENATKVSEALKSGVRPPEKKIEFPGHFPPPLSVVQAIEEFADKENGGYGEAPKFPHFAFLEWSVEQLLEGMIPQDKGQHFIKTIENLLLGGVFDQVRGGIHRYSVDNKYQIPHFEKMLYDQAGLVRLLAKTSLLYPSVIVIDSLIKTLDYLEAEMLHDEGYFLSAQDADSEGIEGLYFTYTLDELKDITAKTLDQFPDLKIDTEQVIKWMGATQEGSFERGLNVVSFLPEYKQEFFQQDAWEFVRSLNLNLLAERKQRIPPATDNKGIASWNFFMLSSLVDAIQYTKIDIVRNKATRLMFKVLEGMHKAFFINTQDNKMLIRHSTTKPNSQLYLEDYIQFADSQLRVYEITGNHVFKENYIKSLNFILKEFVSEDKIYALSFYNSEDQNFLPPKQEAIPFDQSFKSSLSTLFTLMRRAQVHAPDAFNEETLKTFEDQFKQFTLMSPIGCGEGLRANTYPNEVYRTLKLPLKWLEQNEYLEFICYFLPRFTLSYHDREDEKWEICSASACEKNGDGLEEFIKTLGPKNHSHE